MAVVQTAYPNFHEALVPGQIVDTQTCDVDSLVNVGDDDIPFGYAVRQASAAGSTAKQCELGVAANVFRGIAVQDERLPAKNGARYKKSDHVSVLWRGDIAVKVSHAVSIGQNVVAAIAAAGGAEEGQLSSQDPAGANFVAIEGARFMTAAGAGGLAVVRLAGPVPAA